MSEEHEPYDNGGAVPDRPIDVRVVDATSFTSIVATAIGMIDGAMDSDLPRSHAEMERLEQWCQRLLSRLQTTYLNPRQ